jgi:ubiquinone/menaquinone biosynthesis C-methylase UbiE
MVIDDTLKANCPAAKDFENLYIATREKEHRVYTDEQVAFLPSIEIDHIHYHEWQVRNRSATRLFNYLQSKHKPLSILEVGCGNGWLAATLSLIKHSQVTGIDVNNKELSQAKRVFNKKENIHFLAGDIREDNFKNKKFDVVIFAASLQYFSSFEEIITAAQCYLNKNGEIHILDTMFYKEQDIHEAAKRSSSYYRSLGYEAMSGFYFHHSLNSLKRFNYKLLFDPAAIKNKLFRKKDPFPWIMITA